MEHREDQSTGQIRSVKLLEIPIGAAGADVLLGELADALAGVGSALALVPAGHDDYAQRIRSAVGFGGDSSAPTVDSDIALVLSTSGSLGHPKGVLLPAAALLASAHAAHEFLDGPGSWLLAVPVTSVAGVQVLVRSLIAQTEPVTLASIGGASAFDPAEFAKKTWALDPSLPAYCSLVPTQIARILEHPEATSALQGFDAVLIGGARLPESVAVQLDDAYVQWYSTYGMTETSGGLFYNGTALDGAQARLIDIDASGTGRIVLEGPMIARGYLADRSASDAAFIDGAHVTSDLGRIADGRLEVIGRIDDVVQVGGVNVALAAIEEILQRHCKDAVVLAEPDDAWGSAITAYVSEPIRSEAEFLDEVERILGRAARPRTVMAVASIPYSPNGKPDRDALRRSINT
jgi:O-succinylbenzoic acid--CoA ligase